ncbi:MAG: glycosyltransferase family 4 protein [Chlorobi bacterium]|nr:glycosyltransferase family 4 protein [Chlorobiota bacterium]
MFRNNERATDVVILVNSDVKYDSRVRRLCQVIKGKNLNGLVVCSKSDEKFVYGIPVVSLNVEKKGFKSFIQFALRSFLLLINTKFKAVIGCDLDALPSARLASFLKRKTLIFDAHEYITGTEEARRSPWRHFLWELIEQIFIRLSPLGMTVNHSLANIFKNKYGVNYIVLRNIPFLESLSSPTQCLYPPAIIYAGTLSGDRKLDELLKAVATLKFPVQVLISGDGHYREKLQNLSKELGISDRVTFLGMISPSELKRLIAKSWVGVNLLSHNNINFYFSLANKFFDYVHGGIPQITMDFPEYRQLNSEFQVAILLKQAKASQIAKAINKLYDNKQRYLILKQNTLKARRQWNFQKESKKLISILRHVLN